MSVEYYDQALEDKIEEFQNNNFEAWHKIPRALREMYSMSTSMVSSIQQAESDLNNAKKKYNSILRIMNEVISEVEN